LPDTDDGRNLQASALCAGDVVAYLRQHPNFLNTHPELYEVLEVSKRAHGDAVIDFQAHALRHVQHGMQELQEDNMTLLDTIRAQASYMSQVERAITALIDTTHIEGFMERLCNDVPAIFQCDVLRLGLEGDAESYESYYPEQHYSGLVLVKDSYIDVLTLYDDNVWDCADSTSLPVDINELFSECVDLARSLLCIHVDLPRIEKRAVIALGSRHRGYFSEDYDADLMRFFGTITALRLDYYISEQTGLL
jgi:uncharacterized protein YigA (DUF484 family)